jgi:hypothetical protein
VPKGDEKKIQRALMQYRDPNNQKIIIEGLKSAGRIDLIGNGRQFLRSGIDTRTHKNTLKHKKASK